MTTGPTQTPAVAASPRESQWLLVTLARLFAATFYLLFWVSIGLGWPMENVGNAFQLLGVMVAALGVPVVSPFLARVEAALQAAMTEAKRWTAQRRDAIKSWWARLRGHGR